jgi:4a-hydroxytetrahydrobiopterin dehydratase
VKVRLNTHDAGGITEKDFALATQIEKMIMWQPAREGSALEGTPSDPQYAYISYKD